MEKGVNMDHALHITRRPMSSFSFCNRGHPKAWTGSCSSDPMSTRLLKSLLGSGGDGVGVPLGIERKGHMWMVTDLTILRSHHLYSSTPSSLLTYIWLPGGSPWWGGNASVKWCEQGFRQQQEEVHWQPVYLSASVELAVMDWSTESHHPSELRASIWEDITGPRPQSSMAILLLHLCFMEPLLSSYRFCQILYFGHT